MKKQHLGIAFLVLGAALFLFSNYILDQVMEGRGKIERAQSQVDQANSLFSLNPVSKQVGKGITGIVQNKIDEGSAEADQYDQMGMILRIAGIGLFVFGVLLLVRKKN